MKRDVSKIVRYLEDKKNNDIIYKKSVLYDMFKEDADLLEVLGRPKKKPLNKYEDEDNPTEDELAKRKEIEDYNERVTHEQIVPYLKLNGIQQEVLNFIMFDIRDSDLARYNDSVKKQELYVMCLVHEDDMNTDYVTDDGLYIPRTDLLSYIIKDLLCWSNSLGMQLVATSDVPDIVDAKYYCRTIRFEIMTPNTIQGGGNKYDRFKRI